MGGVQGLEAGLRDGYSIVLAFWTGFGGRDTDTPCTYVDTTVHISCFIVTLVMFALALILLWCFGHCALRVQGCFRSGVRRAPHLLLRLFPSGQPRSATPPRPRRRHSCTVDMS